MKISPLWVLVNFQTSLSSHISQPPLNFSSTVPLETRSAKPRNLSRVFLRVAPLFRGSQNFRSLAVSDRRRLTSAGLESVRAGRAIACLSDRVRRDDSWFRRGHTWPRDFKQPCSNWTGAKVAATQSVFPDWKTEARSLGENRVAPPRKREIRKRVFEERNNRWSVVIS